NVASRGTSLTEIFIMRTNKAHKQLATFYNFLSRCKETQETTKRQRSSSL
ncbi:hypothetical protein L9F63_017117, partial [Diploptera punctata]